MASVWDVIEQRASREQRAALYRLGAARSLVRRLDQQQAALLIKSLLKFRQEVPLRNSQKKKEEDVSERP